MSRRDNDFTRYFPSVSLSTYTTSARSRTLRTTRYGERAEGCTGRSFLTREIWSPEVRPAQIHTVTNGNSQSQQCARGVTPTRSPTPSAGVTPLPCHGLLRLLSDPENRYPFIRVLGPSTTPVSRVLSSLSVFTLTSIP